MVWIRVMIRVFSGCLFFFIMFFGFVVLGKFLSGFGRDSILGFIIGWE